MDKQRNVDREGKGSLYQRLENVYSIRMLLYTKAAAALCFYNALPIYTLLMELNAYKTRLHLYLCLCVFDMDNEWCDRAISDVSIARAGRGTVCSVSVFLENSLGNSSHVTLNMNGTHE